MEPNEEFCTFEFTEMELIGAQKLLALVYDLTIPTKEAVDLYGIPKALAGQVLDVHATFEVSEETLPDEKYTHGAIAQEALTKELAVRLHEWLGFFAGKGYTAIQVRQTSTVGEFEVLGVQ
jgi:hypothetical protein